jgi:DNA-binding response OmpR family regulator
MPTLILLIESDQVTRTLIRYHLLRAGYAVEESAPDDVLRLLRTREPRLVIADEDSMLDDGQSMDDLWERAPEARSVPLLLLADVAPPAARSGRPLGTARQRQYLAKPVLARQLLSGIGAMLARA